MSDEDLVWPEPFTVEGPPVDLFPELPQNRVLDAYTWLITDGHLQRLLDFDASSWRFDHLHDNPAITAVMDRAMTDSVTAWLGYTVSATKIAHNSGPPPWPLFWATRRDNYPPDETFTKAADHILSQNRLIPFDAQTVTQTLLGAARSAADTTLNTVLQGQPPSPLRDAEPTTVLWGLIALLRTCAQLANGHPALDTADSIPNYQHEPDEI